MLSLYDSFDVPGVPHVKIYRDDEVRHRFYMVSEKATIARDEDGKPLFNFILYARDVEQLAPEERQIERGYLALTTQAGVTSEEETKIRAYLKEKLTQERNGRMWFFRLPVTQTEPELGYPPLWLKGKVELNTVDKNNVLATAGSTMPSLVGSNLASFSATFNQEGAEFFRQAAEQSLLPALIHYELSFAARIPAITITVHGDRGAFYDEVKNYVRTITTSWESWSYFGSEYYYRVRVAIRDSLSSISKFRNSFHNLTITVDDSSLPQAERDEMGEKLEDMAFAIVQNNILPTFFNDAAADVAKEQGVQADGSGIPVHTSNTGTINLTITKSEIVEQQVNPNSLLTQALTPEEIKAQTAYLDLGNPYFQELAVTVSANVNFNADPVYALKVFLSYEQQDEQRNTPVKRAKEILFKSADKPGTFRVVMAKNSEGAPKDSYSYWSELVYKDSGQTIRIPANGTIQSRERELVISYRRLGFIKVNLLLGTMPDRVHAVKVRMIYRGVAGSDADQQFELTRDKPTATFFTYTGRSDDPSKYSYTVTYVLDDSQQMDMPEEESEAETLTISDPFQSAVQTRFLAQADFSVVEKIIVDASYSDAEHDLSAENHGELTGNGESSPWSVALRDPQRRNFTYTVIVLYKNGSRDIQSDKAGVLGGTITVGVGAVDALEVTVISSMIDWTRYKMVIVYLEYKDPTNNINQTVNYTIRQEVTEDRNWKVLLRDSNARSFNYRIRYFGVDSADNADTGLHTTADPVLVVENAATPANT